MLHIYLGRARAGLKRQPIMFSATVFATLLVFGAGWLATGRRSYDHPGPAILVMGLAVLTMLVGLALHALQIKNTELTEQLNESRLALHDFQGKNSALTEQLNESRLALHDFQDKNSALIEQIRESQVALHDFQDKNSALIEQIRESRLALHDLQDKNSALTEQYGQSQLALHDLQTKNSALIEQIAQLHELSEAPVRLPSITGLELLVNRWCLGGRVLTPQDGAALFEQIRIALTIARRDFDSDGILHFVKPFAGTKLERGVFLIQPGQHIPLVLKFDTMANIAEENVRYHRYVAGRLNFMPGAPSACHGQGTIGDEPWSAIAYNLIGTNQVGQVQTFGDFYRTHASQPIQDVLQNHVFPLLGHWWGDPRPPAIPSLYNEYKRLGLEENRAKMQAAIHSFGEKLAIGPLMQIDDSRSRIDLDGIPSLRNPLNWIRNVFVTKQLGEWATNAHLRHDSIVHGDFHAGNLLVSEDTHGSTQAWLIDFPHTHIGPTVQDIARLEADIKFWLMPETSDCKVLYDWESRLLPSPTMPEPGAEAIRLGMTSSDPRLQKDWSVIYLLREQARRYIHDWAYNYYLALLYTTLPILYYRDRTTEQKLHALISAALLCERLGG
jgi:Ternary complex associated domain 9